MGGQKKGNYIAAVASNNNSQERTDVSSAWPTADLVCADFKTVGKNKKHKKLNFKTLNLVLIPNLFTIVSCSIVQQRQLARN